MLSDTGPPGAAWGAFNLVRLDSSFITSLTYFTPRLLKHSKEGKTWGQRKNLTVMPGLNRRPCSIHDRQARASDDPSVSKYEPPSNTVFTLRQWSKSSNTWGWLKPSIRHMPTSQALTGNEIFSSGEFLPSLNQY